MKFNNSILLFGLSIFGCISCTSDFEKVPIEQFTIEYVFSKTDSLGTKARFFLNDIYAMMDNGHNRVGSSFFYGGDYLDSSTDDAITSSLTETESQYLLEGRFSSTSLINAEMRWSWYYQGIRKTNIFIANIDVVPFIEVYANKRPLNSALKAEARFLRAYFYFEMVKRYGGVPIVGDHVYELGENIELPRSSFAKCIEYIVGELDEITADLRTLPLANPAQDAHVVTVQAAMALKSRVLLYAASPLFNEKPIESGNELIAYESYDRERWKVAADAAKWFIDNYGDGKIFNLTPKFKDIFLAYYSKTGNPELIFFHQGTKGRSVEQKNGPIGYTGENLGAAQTCPTQNLVDAFPMLDGSPIEDSKKYPYDFNDMYNKRDPRLDMTVLHNGSKWLGGLVETFEGGRSNPVGAVQKTKTSYHMRKFMGDYENTDKYGDVLHLWVMYRYAEILLNYAEALNEYATTSPSDEVYNVIKSLRKRAGIEAGDDNMYGLKANMNKDEMRKIIHNERRIELAFEEHRYWDIRRWREAEDVFKKPLKGLVVVKNPGSLAFNEITVRNTSFDTKRYFYPIPYNEVIKNKNMRQNPKW